VDYRIFGSPEELKDVLYFDIGPGKFSRKHWKGGCLFVSEYEFGMAEGIIAKHFPTYNHFGPNDIPKELGLKITAEWAQAAVLLDQLPPGQIGNTLNLNEPFLNQFDPDIESHKADIAGLLRSLAEACEALYQQGDWICISGV
jgi:hypothetical protein